jgi:hypothetical protein
MPCVEITLLNGSSGFGFVLMIAVANVCYFVGPLCESVIKPEDVTASVG